MQIDVACTNFPLCKKNHANLRIMQKMHILKLLDNAKKADYKFACFPPEINQTNLRTWHRGTCTELVHNTPHWSVLFERCHCVNPRHKPELRSTSRQHTDAVRQEPSPECWLTAVNGTLHQCFSTTRPHQGVSVMESLGDLWGMDTFPQAQIHPLF